MHSKVIIKSNPSIILWREIFEITEKVCKHFGLTYGKLIPEARKLARSYGETASCKKCRKVGTPEADRACEEKVLSIRIHHLGKPNKPLAIVTIMGTLAHELAHLREWNHGPAHRRFTKEILGYIREIGYEV